MTSLPVNCFIHPAGRPINTSWLKVLRRLVESAQYGSFAPGHDAFGNAMAVSFFSTLECDYLAKHHFTSHAHARLILFRFIQGWYHPHRRNSAPGQRSLLAFEHLRAVPSIVG